MFQLVRLREGECVWGFIEAISGCFTPLDNLTDPLLVWDTFKCETLDAAQLVNGFGIASFLVAQVSVTAEKGQETVY